MNYNELAVLDCVEYVKTAMFIYEHLMTLVSKTRAIKRISFQFLFFNILLNPAID